MKLWLWFEPCGCNTFVALRVGWWEKAVGKFHCLKGEWRSYSADEATAIMFERCKDHRKYPDPK